MVWIYDICLTVYLLRNVWDVSNFWLLQIKLLRNLCTGFCENVSFHFFEINAREYNWCVILHVLF